MNSDGLSNILIQGGPRRQQDGGHAGMNSNWLRNTLVHGVIGALIGWLLSILREQPKDWALLIELLVITVVLGIIAFEINQIHRNVVRPSPKVTFHGVDAPDRTKIYAPVTESVAKAKRRIAVVTYHTFSPSPTEPAIDKYYDMIESVVDQCLRDKKTFYYTRIYQLPSDAPFSESRLGKRDFAHFQKYQSHDNSLSSVQINFLRASPSVQASLLIVDDSDIFIGIPQTTPCGVILTSVIHIHDETGKVLQSVEKLLTSVQGSAEPVRVKAA